MEIHKKFISVFVCLCARCGRKWDSKKDVPPAKCPWCASRNWWRKPLWTRKKK